MPIGRLIGYSLKIPLLPADHTYVVSSHGHVWRCWGRSAGGVQICAGTGNTTQADCLSQPNSEAGIAYGRTGVCHQTANRILYPCGETVSGAAGYRGSVFAWGTYGRDPATGQLYSPSRFPWVELESCIGDHTHP
jgi:hypothetical protein